MDRSRTRAPVVVTDLVTSVDTVALDRTTALDRYRAVRSFTEALAGPLSPEDQVVQSMPDVSPTKWHRAHVTWFFETFVLEPYLADYAPFHPAYRELFNSYYDQIGAQYARPDRGLVTRPGVAEVAAYRTHVDAALVALLEGVDNRSGPDVASRVELGLHHEQQHQELLLMDIKHVLSRNPLDPVYAPGAGVVAAEPTPSVWRRVDGGLVEIGHPGEGFAFDNEMPRHAVLLAPFSIADRPVTAGEWIEFIDDGGYRDPGLWLSDGWAAVCREQWDSPLYWRRDADTWTQFTLAGRRDVDVAEPVTHVSHYEADAFARWAGARLPTEVEWEHAARSVPVRGGFLDESSPETSVLHPRPAPPAADGLRQMFGDVWEWTASAYLPYPGFFAAAGALGEYNGKFMSGQMVLRGGACVTPPGHVRTTYRNFFPPGARWMFGGLRLARDS